jgi:hypothetical protein
MRQQLWIQLLNISIITFAVKLPTGRNNDVDKSSAVLSGDLRLDSPTECQLSDKSVCVHLLSVLGRKITEFSVSFIDSEFILFLSASDGLFTRGMQLNKTRAGLWAPLA